MHHILAHLPEALTTWTGYTASSADHERLNHHVRDAILSGNRIASSVDVAEYAAAAVSATFLRAGDKLPGRSV